MRVALYTLGCKVNQFESLAIGDQFVSAGHELVHWRHAADIYVVNTCAVTARAAAQSRQMVRRFRREYPEAGIIVSGCHVQTGAGRIMKDAGGRVCMAGNDQKHMIVPLALSSEECLEMYVGDIRRVREIAPFMIRSAGERTRAFVRIQDGCDAFCSYCIVPFARGRSRSMPPDRVYEQIALLAEESIREVVITGIHVGMYGEDIAGAPTLTELLKFLCSAFPDIRFRLSSIDPFEITDEMIEWSGSADNFCPHWHLPLQSGSDAILQAMNRKYTVTQFRAIMDRLYMVMPHAAFGIDVMTGFPGEGRAEFLETLTFLSSIPLSYLHVFPYSSRPDTMAAAMNGHVSKKEKNERARVLRELGERKKTEFYTGNLGTVHDLLVEHRDRKTGLWYGVTENYVSVLLAGRSAEENIRNTMLRVRIVDMKEGIAVGKSA